MKKALLIFAFAAAMSVQAQDTLTAADHLMKAERAHTTAAVVMAGSLLIGTSTIAMDAENIGAGAMLVAVGAVVAVVYQFKAWAHIGRAGKAMRKKEQ